MSIKNKSWFVDINKVKTDYVVIENLEQFKSPKVPYLHPEHPNYKKFWGKEFKRCIEGVWGKEFGQFRFMPPKLYFFGNYGIIEITDHKRKKRILDKPKIVDFIWDYAYESIVAYGFSGFSRDDHISCHYMLKLYLDGKLDLEYVPEECYRKDGNLKEFEEPLSYVSRLHHAILGKPLYGNQTQNINTLGCHAKGTPIRMYNGSLKNVEDITTSDLLMGRDSLPRRVLDTHTGRQKMYKISSQYNDEYIVNEDHILRVKPVKNSKEQEEINITVKKALESGKRYSVVNTNIVYKEQPLEWHPYILGLWLGDGFKREKMICGSWDDNKILQWLIDYCNKHEDYSFSLVNSKGQLGGNTWRITLKNEKWKTKNNWFSKTLRNNKHIPSEYLINSTENRLKLLAGLLDSDGSYEEKPHRFTFTNIDYNLILQVQDLCRSLGFRTKISKSRSGISNSLKYGLRITGDIHLIPTVLERKQAKEKTLRRRINYISIEELEVNDYYGFEVDVDNLYLLGDYQVTHNSRGGSKALLHGSKVQTINGEKLIEEIQVGDKVIGQDGKETNVINVSPQGQKDIYRVTFNSGRTVDCCEDHLWEVKSWSSNNYKVLDTKTILKDFKEYKVRNNDLIEYPTKKLDTHPYVFGRMIRKSKDIDTIPNKYLYGDSLQRQWLLNSILGENKKEFSYDLPQMVKDVARLARSLGIAVYQESSNKILLSNNKHDIIKNIEKVGFDYATCISVDNKDKLFLTNDFVVTHNSYWKAVGEIEHNYVFRGAKYYEDYVDSKCDQCVGAGDTEKSSDLLDKFEASQLAKTNTEDSRFVEWFGIYTELKGDGTIIHASPMYVKSSGTLAPSNKKNKYRNKYKKKVGGDYKEIGGSNSSIVHVNFSPQKGEKGDTAAAGGRYLFVDVEEVGLLPNYIGVLGSNEGTISTDGVRYGVQACQGTSGSLDNVQAIKKVFLDPRSYNMVAHKNYWSDEGTNGEIGNFLPYYVTLFTYKDKNGNTDFKAAIDEVNRQREEYSKSKDPKVLRDFLMNKPCIPYEMWYTDKGYYLPSQEASERNRELLANNLYMELGTPVELFWKEDKTVGYNIVNDREPHYHFPVHKDMKDPSGCVVIYEMPEIDPYGDMYCFIGHDPYIAEELDKGGSLGVTYILKNPKYLSNGRTGNIIVASYIGKPIKGLDYYYDQQEKLIAMYGNNVNSLWYESNRGDICRAYYLKKNKFDILATTPQYFQGNSIFEKKDTRTGFHVGSNGSLAKKNLLKTLRDWLLEETEIKGESKMNLFRIPCKFLIDQIERFNIEDNFDAVSAMIGCVLGLREYELRFTEAIKEENNRIENFFGKSLKSLVN